MIMQQIKEIYKKNKEIVRYLIVGGMTTIVSLGVYYGCVLSFLDPDVVVQLQMANILSWMASVTFAYFTNRIYVFESANKHKLKEALSFYGARIATLFLDMIFMFLMVTLLGINDKAAKILVQIIILVSNYILSKFFVFRK